MASVQSDFKTMVGPEGKYTKDFTSGIVILAWF